MRPTRITTAEETVTHHIAIKGVQRAALLGILAVALAVPAAAHHPLGGGTPMTAWHGFLSGIGHPVIGFDHLAFVVAVGIASAFVGLRYFAPAIFIAATVVGCLLALAIGPMAQLEMMISASVALIGIMLLSGRTFPSAGYMALFAVAGVLHGGAYAGAVVGAEATPDRRLSDRVRVHPVRHCCCHDVCYVADVERCFCGRTQTAPGWCIYRRHRHDVPDRAH